MDFLDAFSGYYMATVYILYMFFNSLQLNYGKTPLCYLMLKITGFFLTLSYRVSFVVVAGVGSVAAAGAAAKRNFYYYISAKGRPM